MRILILLLLPLFAYSQAASIAAASKKKDVAANCPANVCANLIGWYVASDYDGDGDSGNNSGSPTTWVDLSSRGNDLVAASSDEAEYVSSALNGEPGLNFVSANQDEYWVSGIGDFDNLTKCTVFFVVDSDIDDIVGGYWFSIKNVSNIDFSVGNVLSNSSFGAMIAEYEGVGSSFVNSNTTVPSYGFASFDSATDDEVILHWNGATATAGDTTSEPTMGVNSRVTIGSSDGKTYFDGNIMEIIVYGSILSASDESAVLNYLSTKYGL